jgi:hypothetical protein
VKEAPKPPPGKPATPPPAKKGGPREPGM